jgi:hypothetical protein
MTWHCIDSPFLFAVFLLSLFPLAVFAQKTKGVSATVRLSAQGFNGPYPVIRIEMHK